MHTTILSEVLVFKTNIETPNDLQKIKEVLQKEKRIRQWNVDREDIDNVLRVVTDELDVTDVIAIVSSTGFYCEELPD